MGKKKKVIILGAAGRDFHNFNTVYRDNPEYRVVAFTATQIPGIDGRVYPQSLAGNAYPQGIPIVAEADLEKLIADEDVDLAIMSYSDISHAKVGHLGARVNAAGAGFMLLGSRDTFITANKPVIAVTAVRTGAGKSQISRFIATRLRAAGKKVVAIRHPMPYGNLEQQAVQRMASIDDIDKYHCTIEEREEYEKHVEERGIVYAGVDYQAILKEAETEADVILWDGGNNDLPFYKPNLWITVADPLRAGHEALYYPGETNVRACDVIVIGKTNVASKETVREVEANCRRMNTHAQIVLAASVLEVDDPQIIKGKRVLVVEDGPTLTHGGMGFGAGTAAAREFGARELVDPRPWAVGGIKETFATYSGIGNLIPAMGYSDDQVADLESSINGVDCDTVVIGTPFDIQRIVHIRKPCAVVTYRHEDVDNRPGLGAIVDTFLVSHG
jgi:predicted GTPase